MLAVIADTQIANVSAIDANRTFADIVEAAYQIDHGAFARAALTHQTNHFAGRNIQTQSLDHSTVAIAKPDVIYLDAPLNLGHGLRIDWLRNTGDVVQDFKNTLGPCNRFLGVRHNATHRV